MNDAIFVVSLIGAAVFILFIFFRKNPEEEIEKKKLQQRLEDEFIYDPDTGVKMTLEQAENGYFIDPENPERLKSDQEIEENFDDDERESQYIIRELIQSGAETLEEHDVIAVVNGSEMARAFASFDVSYLCKYSDDIFFGLVYISNQYAAGRMTETIYETQIIVVLKNLMLLNGAEHLTEFEIERTMDFIILRRARKANYNDFKDIVNRIKGIQP